MALFASHTGISSPGLPAFTALLLLTLCGCSPKSAPPPVQADPNLQITFKLPSGTVRQLDPIPLTITLRDQAGQPVSDAAVNVDLTMPAMDMGKNQVEAMAEGGGNYVGTGRFTMAGDWQATVTATRASHRSVQSFPVQVK